MTLTRTLRHLAYITWPAILAALVMVSLSAFANECPLDSEYTCDMAQESSAHVLGLVFVPESPALSLHAPITRQSPDRAITAPTVAPHTRAVLAVAPKTSPPR